MHRTLVLGALVALAAAAFGACSSEAETARIGFSSSAIVAWNSHGEANRLRIGESLSLESVLAGSLEANTRYNVRVSLRGGQTLVEAHLMSDNHGQFPVQTIMHDVGEFDDVQEGSTLDITVESPSGSTIAGAVKVDTHDRLAGAGWSVNEAVPPHVFATDASGAPQNAFAVGAATLAQGEVGGELHVAGDRFPADATFDLYVVRDADVWVGKRIPQHGDADWIAGPIVARSDANGRLQATKTGFVPGREHIGIYDVLVDLDRNGTFDWSFTHKDGADGEQKVGFTIQYSQNWFKERTSKHILVNLAYDSASRDAGAWRNDFQVGEKVFTYVNPPVVHQYHARATKWVVKHQDWATYWNSQDTAANVGGAAGYGRRPIEPIAVNNVTFKPQNGCTNSPPLITFNAEVGTYDMVLDFDGDGHYDIGRDILDIWSGDSQGSLIDPALVDAAPAAQRVGFTVR
ncbi:MAG: hypothetical protein HY906_06535 [Deltaproteobacteria bacterium]|nr:hypothetical protein [Deltaproteobacteria bacterium]